MTQLKISYDYWEYYPNYFGTSVEDINFNDFLKELKPLCNEYNVKVFGKNYAARRISTTFKNQTPINHSYYDNFPSRPWKDSSTAEKIKETIETELNSKFDYCLAHIYRDGNDKIDYHADKEATNSIVASVTFGASRKFRFRKIDKNSGFKEELILNHGDLLVMKIGCQQKYKHSVPCEKRVKDPRINLTFRLCE